MIESEGDVEPLDNESTLQRKAETTDDLNNLTPNQRKILALALLLHIEVRIICESEDEALVRETEKRAAEHDQRILELLKGEDWQDLIHKLGGYE